ncbi:MAG: hypothetical protein L0K21_00230 [Corynebacterium sp.]|nr:hypothetical protein [Corynebacterium sp.]
MAQQQEDPVDRPDRQIGDEWTLRPGNEGCDDPDQRRDEDEQRVDQRPLVDDVEIVQDHSRCAESGEKDEDGDGEPEAWALVHLGVGVAVHAH